MARGSLLQALGGQAQAVRCHHWPGKKSSFLGQLGARQDYDQEVQWKFPSHHGFILRGSKFFSILLVSFLMGQYSLASSGATSKCLLAPGIS